MSKFVVTQKNTKETLDYVTMPDDEEKKKEQTPKMIFILPTNNLDMRRPHRKCKDMRSSVKF